MTTLDKYRMLEMKLLEIRLFRGIIGHDDEEPVLDQMDWLWQKEMSADEKKAVSESICPTENNARVFQSFYMWTRESCCLHKNQWVVLIYDGSPRVFAASGKLNDVINTARTNRICTAFYHYCT